MAREKRTVRIRSFDYKDPEGVEHIATRGDEVELTKEDIARGDAIVGGAFESTVEAGSADDAVAVSELDDAGLEAWIRDEKPKVGEVVEAAGTDSALAHRLLDAENAATGQDPRPGVVKGLEKVISDSTQ